MHYGATFNIHINIKACIYAFICFGLSYITKVENYNLE